MNRQIQRVELICSILMCNLLGFVQISVGQNDYEGSSSSLSSLRSVTVLRGVARGGVLGCPWPSLGRPSFEQTTYNIQVAKPP